MRRERQVELLQRVAGAGPQLAGLHIDASMVNDASVYTDPAHFEREMALLFRAQPVLFALSGDLTEPGSYRAALVAGVPVVVVRQEGGGLGAFVNVCRHRGAPLVDEGIGGCARTFACPYHAWTYGFDGALRGRPGSAGAFDDVAAEMNLLPLPVAEAHGLIFVRAGGGDPIDVDAHLAGAEDDLASYGLADYVHVESRTNTWPINWKLVIDTFTESYHVRTLHRNTLGPTFDSYCQIFDAFGPHCMGIGLRKDVVDEVRKPVEEWSLLPYGTIQYFLVPGALVVHQLDHVEVWRLQPVDVRTTTTVTSVYAPTEPHSERSRDYFVKNLDLLLAVTGDEDFTLMAKIQANLDGGALHEVVYGRNEAALVHVHRSINQALA